MLKSAWNKLARIKEQPELFLGQDTKGKLVPCWLMSSEINPGQFGSRMCREQLRSEQILPEASRADRLAYDPERNTLRTPLPLIPVSDGAGVVDAVSEGVRRFRPGDRAVGAFFQGG